MISRSTTPGSMQRSGASSTPEPMPSPTVIAAVVALAGTMTPIAQQKPDFSGEWAVEPGSLDPEPDRRTSFRYELQADGRRLRAAEQLRGGGRDQDNVWVFERP